MYITIIKGYLLLVLPEHLISRNFYIRVTYCKVQPRLRNCKDILLGTDNCLFKKMEIFAWHHGTNIKMDDRHKMFTVLRCMTCMWCGGSNCSFFAASFRLSGGRRVWVNVAAQQVGINRHKTLVVRHRYGRLATLGPFRYWKLSLLGQWQKLTN